MSEDKHCPFSFNSDYGAIDCEKEECMAWDEKKKKCKLIEKGP